MARYQNEIKVSVDPTTLYQPISEYLIKEGFAQHNYGGVNAWKKGVGMLTAPQFFIFSNTEDSILIEAFIKNAILPGVYVGEMGLSGFYGAVPKQLLRTRVEAIENYIRSLGVPQE